MMNINEVRRMTETAVAQKLESLFAIVNGEVDFDAVEIDPQNEDMIDSEECKHQIM